MEKLIFSNDLELTINKNIYVNTSYRKINLHFSNRTGFTAKRYNYALGNCFKSNGKKEFFNNEKAFNIPYNYNHNGTKTNSNLKNNFKQKENGEIILKENMVFDIVEYMENQINQNIRTNGLLNILLTKCNLKIVRVIKM